MNKAIEKHGIQNFKKEILFVFDNEQEMNNKEAELVNSDFVLREDTYNICFGGHGGWGYFNSNSQLQSYKAKKSNASTKRDRFKSGLKSQSTRKENGIKPFGGFTLGFTNKIHTQETKLRMSISHKDKHSGDKNSQFGSMWITNGLDNKKIKKSDIIPEGWNKGRKMKF